MSGETFAHASLDFLRDLRDSFAPFAVKGFFQDLCRLSLRPLRVFSACSAF